MVGSVVNAIAILRYLASSPPLGVNAIARAISLNPSSCFNLLKTLTDEAFLYFDPTAKTYRPAPVPAWMCRPGVDMAGWTRWLLFEFEAIAREYSVTCGLWQVHGERLVLTEVVPSPLETRIHLSVGQRLPIHIGAIGRCVAARQQLPRSEVGRVIAALRWQEAPTVDAYWNGMKTAARQGWAVDTGNFLRGVTSVGAAMGSQPTRSDYCLSATLFTGQLDGEKLTALGDRIAEFAREAGRRLNEPSA